jgi:hypothetical protein
VASAFPVPRDFRVCQVCQDFPVYLEYLGCPDFPECQAWLAFPVCRDFPVFQVCPGFPAYQAFRECPDFRVSQARPVFQGFRPALREQRPQIPKVRPARRLHNWRPSY